MSGIYKFLIAIAIGILMFYGGYKLYSFLNRKIRESSGVLDLLAYSILLFAALGTIYFGGLYLMAQVYFFLS
jgi:predicted PurR-regulated permease PerM